MDLPFFRSYSLCIPFLARILPKTQIFLDVSLVLDRLRQKPPLVAICQQTDIYGVLLQVLGLQHGGEPGVAAVVSQKPPTAAEVKALEHFSCCTGDREWQPPLG